MRVDLATLRDLEFFQTNPSAAGLFDHLDFTQTHQGRKLLRQRFERPPATVAELRDVQRAVRFLSAHTEATWQVDRPLADAVESYLGSNFVTTTARGAATLALAAWWYERRYPEIVQKLCAGISAVQHLLTAIQDPVVRITKAGPPDGVLSHHSNRFAQEHKESGLDRLASGRGKISTADALAWDRRLRGDLRDNLRRMLESAYELDALMAIARANREHRLVMPEIIDDEEPDDRNQGPPTSIRIEAAAQRLPARRIEHGNAAHRAEHGRKEHVHQSLRSSRSPGACWIRRAGRGDASFFPRSNRGEHRDD